MKPLDRSQRGEAVLSPAFLLLAGVAIAALVLSVIPLLQDRIPPEDPRLASRIEALEAQSPEAPDRPRPPADDSRLGAEVRSLRASLERMEQTLESQSRVILDLTAQLGRLEEAADRIEPAAEIAPREIPSVPDTRLETRLRQLEIALAEQIDLFDDHTHTVEARDLQKGWSHASPGWANDLSERRADSAERRLTRPLPSGHELAVWTSNGFGQVALPPEDKVTTDEKIEPGKIQTGKIKRK